MTVEQEALVTNNVKLAHYYAHKYSNTGMEYEDLYQLACEGLVRAARAHTADRGANFATYAAHCINNVIRVAYRKERRRPPTLSWEEPAMRNSEDGSAQLLADVTPDTAPTPEELIQQQAEIELLHESINKLPDRMKKIIVRYYGFDGAPPAIQHEIAKEIGVVQTVISRTINKSKIYLASMLAESC